METISIKILNSSDNQLPSYATEGASGMDLRANLDDQIVLQSMERKLVATGISIELPNGCEAQVRPRSGLAIKQGITCLNSPGTIDSDYRGEIKVILINLSTEPQYINHGDRIAQLVIGKVHHATWQVVHELQGTKRSDGGFGHTGIL